MINKVLKFLPISIFFLIVLIFFYLLISKNDPSKLPSVLLNKEAPKFEAYSLVNKKKFLFDKEFSEELIIVNFFASWCIPCKTEHNFIKELSNKKNLKVIGINYKDNENDALEWLNQLGNPYSKIAKDMKGEIAIDWGVYGIPETFIIYKKYIKYRLAGPITKKNFNAFELELNKYYND